MAKRDWSSYAPDAAENYTNRRRVWKQPKPDDPDESVDPILDGKQRREYGWGGLGGRVPGVDPFHFSTYQSYPVVAPRSPDDVMFRHGPHDSSIEYGEMVRVHGDRGDFYLTNADRGTMIQPPEFSSPKIRRPWEADRAAYEVISRAAKENGEPLEATTALHVLRRRVDLTDMARPETITDHTGGTPAQMVLSQQTLNRLYEEGYISPEARVALGRLYVQGIPMRPEHERSEWPFVNYHDPFDSRYREMGNMAYKDGENGESWVDQMRRHRGEIIERNKAARGAGPRHDTLDSDYIARRGTKPGERVVPETVLPPGMKLVAPPERALGVVTNEAVRRVSDRVDEVDRPLDAVEVTNLLPRPSGDDSSRFLTSDALEEMKRMGFITDKAYALLRDKFERGMAESLDDSDKNDKGD